MVLVVKLGSAKTFFAAAALLLIFSIPVNAGVAEAVNWLKANQQPDGSYGAWAEHQAAAAAMGMFLGEGNSSNVSAALSWLKAQLENPASWFWGAWGEADVPAAAAYAFVQANQSAQLNYSIIAPLLLSFQPSTGFKGYYDFAAGGSVESSVDTALAVMGLAGAGVLPSQNKTAATNFLLALQNPDGSFNLTPGVAEDAIYSQGPDKASMTALALLALKAVNYSNAGVIQNALNYLKNQSASCFSNANYSYSAAMASIAFNEFNETDYSKSATKYLSTLQKLGGGFADSRRSNPNASNALDTGWAAIALAKADPTGYPFSCAPVLNIQLSLKSPVINGTLEKISLSASGPVSNASAAITLPNSTAFTIPLPFNSSSGKWENIFNQTTLVGTYAVTATVTPANGNSTNIASSFTTTLPVFVGSVTAFPNGTTITHCIQVANGSSAEDALKVTGMQTVWASMGALGNALAAIENIGCPASDPWCQCANYAVCCLIWNLWVLNQSSGQWYFSPLGYSSLQLYSGDVFGNIWTSDAAKAPPAVTFSQICPAPAPSTNSSTNSSFTDAATCSSCTANSQCTSGYCVHSTCRAGPTYCGDSYCDSPETCSSCSSDCGACAGGGSSPTVNVKVLFPSDAGKTNINQGVPLSSCPTAHDCFSQTASITCQWYPVSGALACPGSPEITKTCLATAVSGYSNSYGWWAFYVNNGLSNTGISCYKPVTGDVIELRYSTAAYSESLTVTPSPAAQAPAAPSPTPAPASAPTAEPQAANPSPTLYAPEVKEGKEFGQGLEAGETGKAAGQGKEIPSTSALIPTGFFTAHATALFMVAALLAALGVTAVYLRNKKH